MLDKGKRKPGPRFPIIITVSVTSLTLAVLVIPCVVFLFHLLGPDGRELLKFSCAVVGGAMALYSAHSAGTTLLLSVDRERKKRSLEILDKLNDVDEVAIRKLIERQIMGPKVSDDEKLTKIDSDSELHENLVRLLGLFEDISISIQAGIADEIVLYESINFMLIEVFRAAKPYIERLRKQSPEYYEHAQKLCDKWIARHSLFDGGPLYRIDGRHAWKGN